MPRPSALLLAVTLIACGSDVGDPRPPSCATSPDNSGTAVPPTPTGSSLVSFRGHVSGNVYGRATAYQQGTSSAAYSVIDAYQVDADKRPSGELFLLVRSVLAEGETKLTAVTLDELNDPEFTPSGAIAAYADNYDATARKYTRWLVAKSGCIRVSSLTLATPTARGRAEAIVALDGEWRSHTGTLLGTGTASVAISAPLLDLRSGVGQPADSMRAVINGVTPAVFTATGLEAFQVIHPEQTRMVIVGTQPADTTREMWLSLSGVPAEGDSIALGTVTLAEARATRPSSAKSFAMLRMIEFEGTTPVVRELWTSTSGYVKFDRVTQNGPLALCGLVSGSFEFLAASNYLGPGTYLGNISVAAGHFKSKMTVLAPADTLVDPATVPVPAPKVFRMASPNSTKGFGCP